MSNNKEQAINVIIALTEEHNISVDEIAARIVHDNSPSKQTTLAKTLLGYIGGLFIFSGICLLVSMMWDDMGSAQRLIATFGTGMIALIMGAFTSKDERFTKASTPFFLVAGLLEPAGMFVFLDEYMPPGGDAQLAAICIFAVLAIQQVAMFKYLRRASILFLAIIFWSAFLATAMDWLDIDGDLTSITVGLSLLLISFKIDKTPYRAITPFWYFCAALFTLGGYWALVEGSMLDLSFLGLNVFFIYLSLRLASRTLLFVSVIGLLAYLSYFTAEYFADIIGWPVALIIMGLMMIGLSAYALKINQKISAKKT